MEGIVGGGGGTVLYSVGGRDMNMSWEKRRAGGSEGGGDGRVCVECDVLEGIGGGRGGHGSVFGGRQGKKCSW